MVSIARVGDMGEKEGVEGERDGGRSRKVAEAREIAISVNEGREDERRKEKGLSFVTCGLDRARGEIWGR